jgi:HSP20 family protein
MAEMSVILAKKATEKRARRLQYGPPPAAARGGLQNHTTPEHWRRTMFLQTTRRPLEGFQTLRRLNNVLDEAFATWPFPSDENGSITSAWHPACDVFEDKQAVKIVAELPGVKPEDVKLSLENNLLTIRGEKKQEAEERSERVHRYERSYGSFERAFVLPSTVDPDNISADYSNGVLTVSVPKAERARPREIPVRTG